MVTTGLVRHVTAVTPALALLFPEFGSLVLALTVAIFRKRVPSAVPRGMWPTNVNTCPTNDYAWQDLFDVGANYLNKFGDFTVALYGAFAYASFVPGFGSVGGVFPNVAANQITGANLTAWKQWVVGAQFGFVG